MKDITACEAEKATKIRKLQLPNHFKKIGLAIAILSFVSLLINKFSFDSLEYKQVVRYGMLIGVLIISISREKIEDELIKKLRLQSYTFAFIAGVLMSMLIPLFEYIIDALKDPASVGFTPAGDFQILWMLLIFQILYFEVLKRSFC